MYASIASTRPDVFDIVPPKEGVDTDYCELSHDGEFTDSMEFGDTLLLACTLIASQWSGFFSPSNCF